MAELQREFGSHLFASMNDWQWAASWSDLNTVTLTEWFINANRDSTASPDPVRLPRPWDVVEEPVSDVERDRLRAELLSRSAFAD